MRPFLGFFFTFFTFFFTTFFFLSTFFLISSSLIDSQRQALLDLPSILEYPPPLQNWNQATDFCNLPTSPSLTIVCEQGSITHLQIVGNRASPLISNNANISSHAMLSASFSSQSLMLQLSNFTQLKVLQLTSLGLWGPLSSKLGRLSNLHSLNLSSNFFSGALPNRLMSLQNLQLLLVDDNLLNGSLPSRWDSLTSLTTISLSNNKLEVQLPSSMFFLPYLRTVVLDNNRLLGALPQSLRSAYSLQVLSLAGNQLVGDVPDLTVLTNLVALNVENNQIGPQFPLLPAQIRYLALGRNRLQGLIPSSLAQLAQLEQLDLSSNFLSGVPPTSFFALPSIKYLNVAKNHLSGNLPSNLTLSPSLKMLDLSFNILSGGLPSHFISSSSEGDLVVRFQGNCFLTNVQPQNPSSYCQNAALASSLNPHLSGFSSLRNRVAFLAGITGGAVGVIFAAVLLLLVVTRRRKGRVQLRKSSKGLCIGEKAVDIAPELLSNARYVFQTMQLGTLSFPPFRDFSVEELCKATDYFHESALIGEGSKGKVYKGQLEDGSFVAIKCLRKEYVNSMLDLKLRLEVLGKCRHQNLVSLLGYTEGSQDEASIHGNQVFLIYEYVLNKTLRSTLSDRGHDSFGWLQRLHAIIGAAKGIHFLHSGLVPGIFANDITATSILLDQTLIAKLSDYGLPRPGIEDYAGKSVPTANGNFLKDKINRKNLADKTDVYNFGLILLEVILGRPPTISTSERPVEKDLLVSEQGPSLELIDAEIVDVCTMESLSTVVEITGKCLSEDPSCRPSMEDVLWNLQYAVQVQDTSTGESQDEIAIENLFSESRDKATRREKNKDIMRKPSNEEMARPPSPNKYFFR